MDDDYSELKQKLHDRLHFKDDDSDDRESYYKKLFDEIDKMRSLSHGVVEIKTEYNELLNQKLNEIKTKYYSDDNTDFVEEITRVLPIIENNVSLLTKDISESTMKIDKITNKYFVYNKNQEISTLKNDLNMLNIKLRELKIIKRDIEILLPIYKESSPTVHEPTSESTPTDDSLNMGGGDKKTKVQETNYTSSSCSQKKVSSSYSQKSPSLKLKYHLL
jgi:hypothetical protein